MATEASHLSGLAKDIHYKLKVVGFAHSLGVEDDWLLCPEIPLHASSWLVWRKHCLFHLYQDEEKYRRTLWEEEKKKIDEHNAEYGQDQTGVYASLNEFSDMVTDLWIVNSMFLLCTSFQYLLVFNVLFAFSWRPMKNSGKFAVET